MKKIRVIKIKPHEIPDAAYIYPTSEAFLTAIGGDYTDDGNAYLKKIDNNIYAVCPIIVDILDIEGNRKIDDKIICGTFCITETDTKGRPVSMSDENFKKYVQRFFMPESYDYEDALESYYKNRL